ncbi:MAG: hypothetical protein Q9220_000549 [cf. Caloplaca sp. 1 TL-2023]
MQTASQYGDRPPTKRHAPQISISDDNYHVTEAIGDYYGKRESRPLSFQQQQQQQNGLQLFPAESLSTLQAKNPMTRTLSTAQTSAVNGKGSNMAGRHDGTNAERGPLSPSQPLRTRSNSDTANTSFPLNDIEYESNPDAVAQELSNLQALRRMSMNANAAGDPDLPSFPSNFGIPNAPPSGGADEDDRARLYWVPARVHPELAPTEFKTFIDSKVNSIKRRSRDGSLSPDSLHRDGSAGGLRRKKSMLSRQIDNSGGRGAEGYQDGAERLDRKKSLSGAEALNGGISNLQDLEALVNDSETVMQRLSLDTGQATLHGEDFTEQDTPILPAPPGNSLRRSTQTSYRRGGTLRKGERVPYSRRIGRASETDGEDSPTASPITPAGEHLGLSRIQTEPMPTTERVTENFSRPGRLNRRMPQQNLQSQTPQNDNQPLLTRPDSRETPRQGQPPKHFVSQIASNGRSSIDPHVFDPVVPQIVETPPDDPKPSQKPSYVPERSSSHEPPPTLPPQGPPSNGPINNRGPKWPPPIQSRPMPNQRPNQTLHDIASHPSPLPGSSTRTDSLSFIPTLPEDRKPDQKKAKDKRDKEGAEASRKGSWSWTSLVGSDDKEKEKKKEDEARKIKSKVTKPLDKSHDNTRLDLLQTTMEGNRGRESLVLDRGDIKLEEERKKESSRKSSGGEKKEKDTGLLAWIGMKKKGGADSGGKKIFPRNLSPEPPPRILKPDVDYSWTRFSILEERAIYRMAHIKLANPRRALHSQVLLSNFMYSYLAKVQQMHPQIQMPAQKQQAQPKKTDQPEEFYQYQKFQEKQKQEDEAQAQGTSSAHNQTHTAPQHHDTAGYAAETSGHQDFDNRNRPQSRASQYSQHGSETGPGHAANHQHRKQQYSGAGQSQPSPYQLQQLQFDEPRRSDDDDMW